VTKQKMINCMRVLDKFREQLKRVVIQSDDGI
jgi:hypothetical protein